MLTRKAVIFFAFLNLFFIIILALVPPGLYILGMILIMSFVTFIVWHIFGDKVACRLIPKSVLKENILIRGKPDFSKVTLKKFLWNSFLPTLFCFSFISLLYQILGIEVRTVRDLIYESLYSFLLLPFSVFLIARILLERANLKFLDLKDVNVQKVLGYEYIEEFIGFGSVLGFLLTFGQVFSSNLNPAFVIGYNIVLMSILWYPSAIALFLFYKISFTKKLVGLMSRIRGRYYTIGILFRCPNCNTVLLGNEVKCPNCGTQLWF